MKKIYIFLVSVFFLSTLNAQWTRTNVAPVTNAGIADLCVHNGELFTSIDGAGLKKLNNVTNQWDTVHSNLPPNSNAAHITNLASSGNSLYAYVSNQFYAGTTIYKSTDGGLNFVKDTTGHPLMTYPASVAGKPISVKNVFVLNGKIINVISGGFTSKYPEDSAWVAETDPKVKWSDLFAEYDSTWYAWYSGKLNLSQDQGQTWSTVVGTGIPAGLEVRVLNVNPSSGRIYVAGYVQATTKYHLMYSDTEGSSWDSLAIMPYLGVNWIGQQQKIFGLISNGNNITAMLENDLNGTHPDIITSTDGGLSFSVDTVGLQPNAGSTVLLSEFVYFNDKLYFAPNSYDIFVQDGGLTGVESLEEMNVNVYPNPFNNLIQVENDFPIDFIQVMNVMGQVVYSGKPLTNVCEIDLHQLNDGIYFVNIQANNQIKTIKIIKK